MFKKLKIHFGKKSLIFIAVFIVLLAVDLLTKFFEEKYGWNFTVIPDWIWVTSGVHNTGASFSLFASEAWGQAFLKIVTVLLTIALIVVFLFLPERFTLLKLALTMVIAGAFGNLLDRFALGYVRDFVWVNMIFTPACCNFADFWITFGVVIAVVDLLFFNEWAVFPLTQKAKAAQQQKKQAEANKTDGEKEDAQGETNEASRADGERDDG